MIVEPIPRMSFHMTRIQEYLSLEFALPFISLHGLALRGKYFLFSLVSVSLSSLRDADEGANRRRRDLVEFLREGKASGDADAGTAGRTRSLSDEDPCSSQMWILVNTSAIIDGFPYCECL